MNNEDNVKKCHGERASERANDERTNESKNGQLRRSSSHHNLNSHEKLTDRLLLTMIGFQQFKCSLIKMHNRCKLKKNKLKQQQEQEQEQPTEQEQAAAALDQIRGNKDVLLQIYSFLPVTDRIRLGGVDKEFHDDHHYRGRIVGVYGDDNLDISEAFERVREYLKMEGTPWSLSDECVNYPLGCWEKAFGETLYDTLQEMAEDGVLEDYFDEEEGYDTDMMADEMLGETVDEAVLEHLDYVNWYRSDDDEVLDSLESKIEALGEFAPYWALYDLLIDVDLDRVIEPFLRARKPAENDKRCSYTLSTDGGESFDSLEHLKPGRMFIFRDADGALDHKVFKRCVDCGVVKDNTRREYCEDCGDGGDRCPDCTTEFMCGECEVSHCLCRRQDHYLATAMVLASIFALQFGSDEDEE